MVVSSDQGAFHPTVFVSTYSTMSGVVDSEEGVSGENPNQPSSDGMRLLRALTMRSEQW